MTTRHTISNADKVYVGSAFHAGYSPDGRRGVELSHLVAIDLGAPVTADTDGIADGVVAGLAAPVAVTLATDTLDVPRNLVVSCTDNTEADGTVTITGLDVYGEVMVEEITCSGTSVVQGKKAFKELSSVVSGASLGGITYRLDVGWGNAFGLPFRLDRKADLYSPQADGSVEDFTVVVADTDQDATAGDCRGTVTPATTPNGAVRFSALIHLRDLSSKAAVFGYDQYSG